MRILEFRLEHPLQPLTGAWQQLPVAPRGATLLGISFRPLQAAAFGLDAAAALQTLLAYPYQVIRLGAYWSRIEPESGAFHTDELDRQVEAAERAGKQIILCLGPVKTFGYPEFFVPAHHLAQPFPEGKRIQPSAYPSLSQAAAEHIARLVERYRSHTSLLAWQLEHEAVDPLGVEHSWRLDASFVAHEAVVLRQADPTHPLIMNGFLPTSWPVHLSQGWRTRDQGDLLAVAQHLADMVGIDYYPRHALLPLGRRTLYLDGSQSRTSRSRRKQLIHWAIAHNRKLLVAEGQAEPWETVTVPANPHAQALFTCLPEHLITNYNTCLGWFGGHVPLYAYLFWGAEYWLLRQQGGDPSYLRTFTRILEKAG